MNWKCSGSKLHRLGDKCSLECRDGYQKVGISMTCTSSINGTVWCGESADCSHRSAKCSPQSCAPAPYTQNQLSATGSRSCNDVAHGNSCSVDCKPGFTKFGKFLCSFGEYRELQSCIAKGTRMSKQAIITGNLVISIQTRIAEASREAIIEQVSFQESLKQAIATGFSDAGIDIVANDVELLSVTWRSSNQRLLLSEALRNSRSLAQSFNLEVNYEMSVERPPTAEALTQSMDVDVTQSVGSDLSKRVENYGCRILNVAASPPRVVITYKPITSAESVEHRATAEPGASSATDQPSEEESEESDNASIAIISAVIAYSMVVLLMSVAYFYWLVMLKGQRKPHKKRDTKDIDNSDLSGMIIGSSSAVFHEDGKVAPVDPAPKGIGHHGDEVVAVQAEVKTHEKEDNSNLTSSSRDYHTEVSPEENLGPEGTGRPHFERSAVQVEAENSKEEDNPDLPRNSIDVTFFHLELSAFQVEAEKPKEEDNHDLIRNSDRKSVV